MSNPMNQPPASIRRYRLLTLVLLAASAGCLLMIVLRVLVTGRARYHFLLWNLFLAWIPYLLAVLIGWIGSAGGRSSLPSGEELRQAESRSGTVPVPHDSARPAARVKLATAGIGLVWLFFYPNAPYILTDFIHVIQSPADALYHHPVITDTALLWYDIILNSAFSFIGHMIGLISLVLLHRTIRRMYRESLARVFVVAAILLGGYGIYLGRFERLNSWDVFRHPLATLEVMLVNLLNLKAVLFSLSFAFFIFLTYLIVYAFSETERQR
jgi:uncharacterized membrane protein